MPIETQIGGGGGGTTVDGRVYEEGPGGREFHEAEVLMLLDGSRLKITEGQSSTPNDHVHQGRDDVLVVWHAVQLQPDPGTTFSVPVTWREGATGPAHARIVAFDASKGSFASSSAWIYPPGGEPAKAKA